MSGVYAVGEGIGEQETANLSAQIATAFSGIMLAPSIVTLNQLYMKAIAEDSLNYADDTAVSIMPDDKYPDPPDTNPHDGQGPHMAAIAGQDNVQKSLDQQQGDLQTGAVQNIVETIKSNASYLGQTLNNVFKLESPMIQLLAQISTIIMEIK